MVSFNTLLCAELVKKFVVVNVEGMLEFVEAMLSFVEAMLSFVEAMLRNVEALLDYTNISVQLSPS